MRRVERTASVPAVISGMSENCTKTVRGDLTEIDRPCARLDHFSVGIGADRGQQIRDEGRRGGARVLVAGEWTKPMALSRNCLPFQPELD